MPAEYVIYQVPFKISSLANIIIMLSVVCHVIKWHLSSPVREHCSTLNSKQARAPIDQNAAKETSFELVSLIAAPNCKYFDKLLRYVLALRGTQWFMVGEEHNKEDEKANSITI